MSPVIEHVFLRRMSSVQRVRLRVEPSPLQPREIGLDGEIPVNRADFGLTWNFISIAAMDSAIVVHAVFTRA
jgi:polyisoprenoid-binding protein YceI